ncbi:MAG TPA: nitroreductase family protein [Dokdonella sp.]
MCCGTPSCRCSCGTEGHGSATGPARRWPGRVPAKGQTMELNEGLRGRRAVRDYTPTPVDESAIRRLIDAAEHAPNAFNDQPWRFTVVRDQRLLQHISDAAKVHLLDRPTADPRAGHLLVQLGDPAFHIFYHAPVLVLIGAEKAGPWVVEDCALAAENLMLAAHAEGLGSCWIGFAQEFLNTVEGRNLLGVDVAAVTVAPIIVGHPRTLPPSPPRRVAAIRWIG